MRILFAAFLLIGALTSCSIDREIKDLSDIEKLAFEQFQGLPERNKLKLVADKEPGQKLHICGTLKIEKDSIIIPRKEILVYHANAMGLYEETIPGEESTARINGRVFADDVGRFYIETIMPGDYPNRKDNRHIHTLVKDAKPEAYDIHFRQYTDYLASEFIRGSEQHFNATLKQNEKGELVIFVDLVVQKLKKKKD